MYLDATFLDAHWARRVENVSALVAYALGPDGHRRLLRVALGAEQSEGSWSELLEQLVVRGLNGVQLVIPDEHQGLATAVRSWLPKVRGQRCTVSSLRRAKSTDTQPPVLSGTCRSRAMPVPKRSTTYPTRIAGHAGVCAARATATPSPAAAA